MKLTALKLLTVILLGSLTLLGSGGGNGSAGCPVGDVPELLGPLTLALDPFGTAPLSARLTTSIPLDGTFTITVQGMAPDGIDISGRVERQAGRVEVPILGLYANYSNTVAVDFEGCNGQTSRDTLTITTGPLPGPGNGQVTLPVSIEIDPAKNKLPADDQSLYLFSQQKSAFDQTGAVRWTYLGQGMNNGWQFYRQLDNGNWLGNINTNQVVYHFGDFGEFTMLGEMVASYSVDNYLHHEVQKLPSGNYLVASNSTPIDFADNGVPEEDIIFEYNADTGLIVNEWDFNLILDPNRTPIPTNNRPDDWLHNNAIDFDETDDTILITAQRQSILAKIRYEYDGPEDLLWILGAHEQWPIELQNKLLQPVDELGNAIDPATPDFWPYGPHAGVVIDNDGQGNLKVLAFDNGVFRDWYNDNQVPGTSYSRGVEYAIDENNMTVQLTWQYDAGRQLATDFTGDIDQLANGNRLLGFAWTNDPQNPVGVPRVVEVDPDGNVVFEAVSNDGEREYRVEKIDLYAGQ